MNKLFLMMVILYGTMSISMASELTVKLNSPKVVISNIPIEISFELIDDQNEIIRRDTSLSATGLYSLIENQNQQINTLLFKQGIAIVPKAIFTESGDATIRIPQIGWKTELPIIPGWLSLIPPLVAILLALIARQVAIQ